MSDLASYLESGELPSNDPEVLAKLYQEAIGEESTSTGEQAVEDDKASSAATGATEATTQDDGNVEATPEGILSKNGKNVIPYDVLEAERREKAELKAEIERLKAAPATTPTDNLVFSQMTDEQIAELKEYFPEQYQALVSQQAALTAAQQKLSTFEQKEAERQAEAAEQARVAAQSEIDNNPLLSHWQRHNPEIFQECVDMDARLMNNPLTASLSMTERFAKVANAIAEIYGNPVKTAEPAPTKDASIPQPAKAPAKPVINSLSDIPGGEAPEASEKQRLEDSSAAEIGNRLMSMTEEQRNAFLLSLG